ncbi:Restriction of telomere capping protein 4 [Cytospora mali]|uniref:Restriction of telomere capping protein 4 n=1 Tax=Cytospora mali TaxID=578113 RepID=A0A194VCY1_CYTMA|nr:Restriction of telomere capping protein 4 [Valsa mali var. pyri (nom. inval.)]
MAPYGLPRHGVPPLLSFAGGRRRTGVPKPLKEPEDITAPPMESSESEEELDAVPRYQDSSDDDQPARGDMGRSTFGSKKVPTSINGTRGYGGTKSTSTAIGTTQLRSARTRKKRAVDDIENTGAEESDILNSGKKAKMSGENSFSSIGSHMGDGYLVERQKKPLKARFGKNARKLDNASSSRDSTPRRKFEMPESMSASSSPEKAHDFRTTQLELEPSSPVALRSKPSRTSKSRAQSESSELSELESSVCSDPPRPLKARKIQKPNRRQPKKGRKKNMKESTPEDVSQQPKFKMPEGYDDFTKENEPARVDIREGLQQLKKSKLDPGKALCPMCDEPIDKKWLGEFSRNQRMSITRQAKFCQLHKKRSAKETWEAKGYPEVNWGNLETRIARQHAFLESLINGEASHFGEVHRETIQTGKNRTLLKTEDYLTPGYYGLRGMSIMTETIIEMFSALLRERAPKYKLISARGYTGFVQSVLVPELAVKLIQEDMSLHDEEEARVVMKESRAVGEILNDEKQESRTQMRGRLGGDAQEDAMGGKPGVNGKKSDGGENVSVNLRIQVVNDSDSELSSLASSIEKPLVDIKKTIMDSDSALSSPASSGRKEPAGMTLEGLDSDSELSSLADL